MAPRSPKSHNPERPSRSGRRRRNKTNSPSSSGKVAPDALRAAGKDAGQQPQKAVEKPRGGRGNKSRASQGKQGRGSTERSTGQKGKSRSRKPVKRILWIPGLGADGRMYGPLIAALKRGMPGNWQHDLIDFPTQDSLKGIHSLQSLSEKTLEHCIRPLQKDRTSRTIYYDTVVGVSMGGMIAQILVGQNLIRTDNLILISTAYRGSDVRQPFLATAWMPGLLPGFLRSLVQWVIGKSYPLFRRNVAEAREFARMFLDFPRKIFFDAPSWIKRWPGEPGLQATLAMKPLPSDSQSLRVFRIHGTSDPLLSYRKIQKRIHLDQVFEKGSHIVFATEASAIAKSMKAFLTPENSSDLSSYLDHVPSTKKKSRSPGSKRKDRSQNNESARGDADGRNRASRKGSNSRKRRKKSADVG